MCQIAKKWKGKKSVVTGPRVQHANVTSEALPSRRDLRENLCNQTRITEYSLFSIPTH